MIRRQEGFTLVELMITMVVFVMVIAAASNVLTTLLTQFKQQSKIAEAQIEGVLGLEILRQDIEHAGYGLPWTGLVNYQEAAGNPAQNFNDAPANPPRAVLSDDGIIPGGSDYLVIKSVNVARNGSSDRWTLLKAPPFAAPHNPRVWSNQTENLSYESPSNPTGANPYVTVISMGPTATTERRLVTNGGTFYAQLANITSNPWPPADNTDNRIVYGIDPDTVPRMPFNRADYYISWNNVPQRCAQNTGVLVKAVVNHKGGFSVLPLLDCVYDFQVGYRFDMDENGTDDTSSSADGDMVWSSQGFTPLQVKAVIADSSLLRKRLREVRVFILAHEGQKDINYLYGGGFNSWIDVGSWLGGWSDIKDWSWSNGMGRTVNVSVIPDWSHYRWKVYTLIVSPKNLR